jgi:hypothetical protein
MRLTPENFPIVQCLAPAAASVTEASVQPIYLGNANGVLIIIQHSGTDDNDMTFTVHEGATEAEALAGTYAISATFPIWANAATATSDTLVRATDAASYVLDSDGGGTYLVTIYISASILTSGRDWVSLGFDGGSASNIVSAIYILDGARYKQETPPTAVE